MNCITQKVELSCSLPHPRRASTGRSLPRPPSARGRRIEPHRRTRGGPDQPEKDGPELGRSSMSPSSRPRRRSCGGSGRQQRGLREPIRAGAAVVRGPRACAVAGGRAGAEAQRSCGDGRRDLCGGSDRDLRGGSRAGAEARRSCGEAQACPGEQIGDHWLEKEYNGDVGSRSSVRWR
jgi:hypothetical protein